jgi:hypothetical protein
MIAVEFTQYLRPDGRTKPATINVADDLSTHIEVIKRMGARLECEVLMPDMVSLTISDPELEEDFDMELVPNGPGVLDAVDRLIRRFTQEQYHAWQRKSASA